MDNMLIVAIFCGLWYAFAGWRPCYLTHNIWLFPLTSALPIGILMGDVPGAMILGSAIGMLYVGLVAPGSEIPADQSSAGLVGVAIGLAIGADTGTAIAIAVPIGAMGVFLNTLRRLINAKVVHMADKHAANGNAKGIRNCALWWPLLVNFVTKFPIMFVMIYFGTDVIDGLLKILPDWIMNGLSVAGGMMPAIGFAILINVIAKRSILPFYFLGFFVVEIFSVSALQLACLGVPMVVAVVLMSKDAEENTVKRALQSSRGSMDDNDDDDDE